jgi:hypothetical protein
MKQSGRDHFFKKYFLLLMPKKREVLNRNVPEPEPEAEQNQRQ